MKGALSRMTTAGRLGLFGIGLFLAGCAAVPPHMEVDRGLHPDNRDRDVRFRTTYYFRVFDYCEQVKDQNVIRVPFGTDSLYRYRMTGKAPSLTNRIHFESGTLTAGEIEPFGSNVAYDADIGQFYYKTQSEVKAEAQRAAEFRELKRLTDEYQRLSGDRPLASPGKDEFLDGLKQAIQQQIETIKGPTRSTPDGGPGATGTQAAGVDPVVNYCSRLGRGFQILGPEGWRNFNQDERLVMAMSSSGKPLVSTLRELSGRVLANQPVAAEQQLPLIQEELRITRAEAALNRSDPTRAEDGLARLAEAIEALEREAIR